MVKKRTEQKGLIELPELPKEIVIEELPDGQGYFILKVGTIW